MNVEDVRGFLAVVDQGRVGAAADELGISQSALTRRVQRVEASLGARLFERTGRTLQAAYHDELPPLLGEGNNEPHAGRGNGRNEQDASAAETLGEDRCGHHA